MRASYKGFRLLLVHAHPDDETINNGSTMALYAALGAQVTLVTCTRGEEGDVLVNELSHLAANQSDQLGQHRITELAEAMKVLGVSDHRFLAEGKKIYRDSGMMGTDPNNRPDAFWQADIDEAASYLIEVIDEIRPHVLITYDEFGGYGHPDHINAHRVAMKASEKSKWKVPKIYWNVMPKSVIQEGIDAMKKIGSDFMGVEKAEDLPFAKEDSFVHAMIDGNAYVEKKMDAMRAHATQIEVDGPFFALSNNLGLQVWGNEYYTRVRGEGAAPFDSHGYESDLFAGLEPTS